MRQTSFRRDVALALKLAAWGPRRAWISLAAGLGATAAQGAFLALTARGLGELVERGLAAHDGRRAVVWLAITIALQAASAAFGIAGRYAFSRASFHLVTGIRDRLVARLPALSFGFLDRVKRGELVSVIVDEVEVVDVFFRDALSRLSLTGIQLAALLATAAVMSPRHTLLLVLGALPPLAVAAALRGRVRRAQRDSGAAEAAFGNILVETASGAETLHGLSGWGWAEDRARLAAERFEGARRASARWLAAASALLPTLCFFPLALVAAAAAGASLGLFTTFLRLAQQLVFPLQALAVETQGLQAFFRAVERILALGDAETERAASGAEAAPLGEALVIDRLSLAYDRRDALRGVTLTLRPGEVIALLGRSGSGKSTIAAALLGARKWHSGDIRWDGVPMRELSLESIRREIAFAPAAPIVFRGTVRENVTLGARVPDDRLREVARAVRLSAVMGRKGWSWDTPLDPAALTPGERQVLQLARTALLPASVYFFDEATSALAPDEELAVLSEVKRLLAGKAIVIVSHRDTVHSICDRTIRLDAGRVRETARGPRLALEELA